MKETFASKTFASKTFASGHWGGLGVTVTVTPIAWKPRSAQDRTWKPAGTDTSTWRPAGADTSNWSTRVDRTRNK